MHTDDDLHMLVGPYLLDALTDEERLTFESHLENCEACRDEVGTLREAVTQLAPAPVTPPAGLRDRIVQEANRTPQEVSQIPRTASRSAARSPWPMRLTAAAAAVLLVAVGGLSYTVLEINERLQTTQETADRFADLVAAPDATMAATQGAEGSSGGVVASPSHGEAVVIIDQLDSAPHDHTYQLWLIDDEQAVSAGLFNTDGDGRATQILATGLDGVDAVGVTLEPASGSPQPTTDPVLAIELG